MKQSLTIVKVGGKIVEDAVALAVEDAHLGSTGQDGVVDEVLHLHQRLVAPHAAQVDFRAEMLDVGIDRAPRDVARRRVGL